jgi:hypothetical protein
MTAKDPKMCAEVSERLAEVLDGTAEARLLEHVSDCDDCRDAKHGAERARKVVLEAAADYRGPRQGLEERVMGAVGEGARGDGREREGGEEIGGEGEIEGEGARGGAGRGARSGSGGERG